MVKQHLLLFILCIVAVGNMAAQKKFFTRTGKVVFYSKAPLEDIKAVNNQVSCIYEVESNRIVAKVLIKAFKFDKALMQKHFNENYLESDKFPKASFKGKIVNTNSQDFNTNWNRNLEFDGNITIHGVTKKIKNPVQLSMKNGVMIVNCIFYVFLKDYEIKVPSTVINNVAEKVKIDVSLVN